MTNERSPRSLDVLLQSAEALTGGSDLDATVLRLLDLAIGTLGADVGVVYLQDPDRTDLQLGATVGLAEGEGMLLADTLADATDPVVATSHERSARDLDAANGSPGTLGRLGLARISLRPLEVSRDGIDLPLGALALGWRSSHALEPDDAALLHGLAGLISVAIDRARLASMITERSEWFERMAHTDPLTGLANQRTFARILELELARAARQGSEISLAVFDVDGLTATNAAAGHEVGDDVLRAVASVLAESVRLVDTVARYGGDEFVLIAPGSAGSTVARRVIDGVKALAPLGGVSITVSAGVAQFPADGASSDELVSAALDALDRARAEGPGRLASSGSSARS